MREAEFRAWLEARRWNGKPLSSISSRRSKARQFEKAMPALGFADADLDAAFDRDGMEEVTERLRDWCREAARSGEAPTELVGQTSNAAMRIGNVASAVRNYRQFRESDGIARSDWPELQELRAAFLDRVPEFERFDKTDNAYERIERAYKDVLIAKVRDIAASDDDDEAAGRRIYRALIPNEGPLLGWQTDDDFARKHPQFAPEFYAAVGRLARDRRPVREAIMAAADQFADLRRQGATALTLGEITSIAITVAGVVRPGDAVPFKITKGRDLARLLIGDAVFNGTSLTRGQLDTWLDLLGRIETVMRDDWGWAPRDLIDVQGFAWVALDSKWVEEDEMADEELENDIAAKLWSARPTNLILYGPPGTGKTYATAEHAVRLCGEVPPSERAKLMVRYHELSEAGRIRFVTFHQSYSYEDFIEGLRPTTEAEEEQTSAGFRLEPVAGVFREIASLADQATKAAVGGKPFDVGDRQVFKMSLGRAGEEDYIFDAAVEGGYVVLGWGGDIDWTPYDSYDAIFARWNEDHPGTHGSDGNISQLWRFRCSMEVGDLVVVSYGNSRYRAIGEIIGDYEFAPTGERDYNHRRMVRWLYLPDEPQPINFYDKPFTMRSCYLLRETDLNRAALALVLPGTGGAPTAPKQFVLICDEINRANISKVFGELITLLEPDKRIGMANELRVALPYSKITDFGVPANLHIIGTMNTADRSIALIDKALRRRFTFTEMMPDYEVPGLEAVVGGVTLAAILRAINDRIEYLLDREHQIGHGWLLGCDSKASLDAAMREKVIPLIAEYFFEDWGRTADVLGGRDDNAFLRAEKLSPPPGLGDAEPRTRWSVRDTFAADAYARLVG